MRRIAAGPLKGCLVDLGSIILDERKAYEAWVNLALRTLQPGLRTITRGDLKSAMRWAVQERLRPSQDYALQHLGAPRGLGSRVWSAVQAWDNNLYSPMPDAPGVMAVLASHYPLVLVSNAEPAARRWLSDCKFDRFFKELIISCEVGVSKPDLKMFELGLNALGCDPKDAVMIGDRLDTDIEPAKRLGLRTVRVRRGPAYWQTPKGDHERPDVTVGSLTAASLALDLNAPK